MEPEGSLPHSQEPATYPYQFTQQRSYFTQPTACKSWG
jgi:hypothetical protein